MRRVASLFAFVGLACGSAGCLSIPSGVFTCADSGDCPSGQSCVGNVCVDGSGPPGCQLDVDCPPGEVCGTGGVCTTTCAGGSLARECESFLCYNGLQTVRVNQLCDGVNNCPGDLGTLTNGLDELSCFSCPGGGPIHSYTHCDGVDDCGDGYDEASCFQCGDGSVTKLSYVCDGVADCDTDEAGCTQFACGGMDPAIDRAYVCDGDPSGPDCPDTMADEDAAMCIPFACTDGSDSIAPGWVCDGWGDCDDGSDEDPANCPFICDGGTRYPASVRCDLIPDCMDGSDEDPIVCL